MQLTSDASCSYADILFTWQVAVASHEAERDDAVETEQHLHFVKLAAASTETPIEGEPWHDDSGQCLVKATICEDRLYLEFQADGFNALEQLMNRQLWLASHDGSVRALCAFDALGRAELVFRNSEKLAKSLRDFGFYAIRER